MSDEPARPPNRLREVRNEVVEALHALVQESKNHGATDRAQILRDAATGIAALETSQAQ